MTSTLNSPDAGTGIGNNLPAEPSLRSSSLFFSSTSDLAPTSRAMASRSAVSVTARLLLLFAHDGTRALACVAQGTSSPSATSNSPSCMRAVNSRTSDVSTSFSVNSPVSVVMLAATAGTIRLL